jgi:predicted SAM-dependent methyltransferase
VRVNLGCGGAYLEGWVNVDADPGVRADVHADAFDFVRAHGPRIEELYMGHFLEHMVPDVALELLSLIADRLRSGALVSAVVPDMRAIFRAYEAGEITNRELNELYVYSYVQPCHHAWCYDADALLELFRTAGYERVAPIEPLTWPPVYWKSGPWSRWQCGVRASVPDAQPAAGAPEASAVVGETPARADASITARRADAPAGVVADRQRLAAEAAELRGRLTAIERSRPYRWGIQLEQWLGRFLPADSRRRGVVRAALDAVRARPSSDAQSKR